MEDEKRKYIVIQRATVNFISYSDAVMVEARTPEEALSLVECPWKVLRGNEFTLMSLSRAIANEIDVATAFERLYDSPETNTIAGLEKDVERFKKDWESFTGGPYSMKCKFEAIEKAGYNIYEDLKDKENKVYGKQNN